MIPGLGRSPGERNSYPLQYSGLENSMDCSLPSPPSMGFSRQKSWSGLPFPSPGDLPDSGIEHRSSALQEPPGKPFRYDLKHIPYDYIVEVTNRFKGLDLIDRVPAYVWT